MKGHFAKKDKDRHRLALRIGLASGEIDGEEYNISLNVDCRAIFVEFPARKERVEYLTADLAEDAYKMLLEKINKKSGKHEGSV